MILNSTCIGWGIARWYLEGGSILLVVLWFWISLFYFYLLVTSWITVAGVSAAYLLQRSGACSTRPGAGAVPTDTRPPELEGRRGQLPHLQGPQGRRRQNHLQSHQSGGTCTTPRAYVLCPNALCGWFNSATWRRCTYTPMAWLCGRIVYSVSTLSYHLSSL